MTPPMDLSSPLERSREALARHSNRYDATMRAAINRCMSHDDRRKLRDWFEDRYNYLSEIYRQAVNDADHLIGKQWAYDNRPKPFVTATVTQPEEKKWPEEIGIVS